MNIQKILNDYIASRQLSGTILIAVENEVVASQCIGFADKHAGIKCGLNTQYLIASITKQFVAVAVLKTLYALANKNKENQNDVGKLEKSIRDLLNKPISYYLPNDSALWSNNMPNWADIVTVNQLLLHSSGVPEYTVLPDFEEIFYKNPPDLIEFVGFFKDKPLTFSPGSLFSYNNSGYILLGAIVEQITQQSLSTYLEENIFSPLGMSGTSLPEKGTVSELKREKRYDNLALGYEYDPSLQSPTIDEVKQYVPAEATRGAGGIISTAPDLLRWNNALYQGKIIPEFLLKIMLETSISTGGEDGFYVYGIECQPYNKIGKFYYHGGGINGYKSRLGYIPKLKMSIICLTNIADNDVFSEDIKAISADFPSTLSDKEKSARIEEALKNKYPDLAKNKDQYHARLFVDELIKQLEMEINYSNFSR